MLIAFEGADSTLKQLVMHRVAEELTPHSEILYTRSPGRANYTPIELEPALNKADFFLYLAWLSEANPVTRMLLQHARVLTTAPAEFVSEFSPVTSSFLKANPFAHMPLEANETWNKLLDTDLVIRDRITNYSARDAIRHALMDSADSLAIPPVCQLLLFLADHSLHQQWLWKADGPGKLILCDRYTAAFQAYCEIVETPHKKSILKLHKALTQTRADKTVLLLADLDSIEESLQRVLDGKEEEDIDTQQALDEMPVRRELQAVYIELAKHNPGRWIVVDMSESSLQEAVDQVITGLEPSRRFPTYKPNDPKEVMPFDQGQ